MGKKNTYEEPLNLPRPFLSSITLGGFQVFDEPTTIPLGQLTFLFGPNSAGKSAVEDALMLLNEALNPQSSPENWRLRTLSSFDTARPEERYERLQKHWRRIDGNDENLAPMLTLGICTNIHVYGGTSTGTLTHPIICQLENASLEGLNIAINMFYRHTLGDCKVKYARRDFNLIIDGRELLWLQEFLGFGVNIDHPLLSAHSLKTDFMALSQEFPDLVECKDGWIWMKSERCQIDDWRKIDRDFFPFRSSAIGHPSTIAAFDELAEVFDLIHTRALRLIKIHAGIVSASRIVPSQGELTHLVTEHLDISDYGMKSPLNHFGLLPGKVGDYYKLAESFISTRFDNNGYVYGRELLRDINRALSEHLFLERGYQLDADFRVIMDLEQFSKLNKPEVWEAGYYPILVQMHLIDSSGRRYSFDEVGSGLGYVLPILCSVFDFNSISLLQQPELHLHPALQSALGDVLIEAASERHQLIVETHSEHLLLRVLKRIRQTATEKPPVPELQLQPEEVVVVYFDPSPDGTTKVKRLRISPDGDFLDQWPHGFFAERDKELFDE